MRLRKALWFLRRKFKVSSAVLGFSVRSYPGWEVLSFIVGLPVLVFPLAAVALWCVGAFLQEPFSWVFPVVMSAFTLLVGCAVAVTSTTVEVGDLRHVFSKASKQLKVVKGLFSYQALKYDSEIKSAFGELDRGLLGLAQEAEFLVCQARRAGGRVDPEVLGLLLGEMTLKVKDITSLGEDLEVLARERIKLVEEARKERVALEAEKLRLLRLKDAVSVDLSDRFLDAASRIDGVKDTVGFLKENSAARQKASDEVKHVSKLNP